MRFNRQTNKQVHQFLKKVPPMALVLCVLTIVAGAVWQYSKPSPILEDARIIKADPFLGVKLSAKSAYIYDAKLDKKIFGLNEDAQLPLASLTKIMTAETALDILPENTIIQISDDSLATEGESGLFANEKWTLKDLLGLTLVQSSNDGSIAVAATAGAVGQIGLTHSEAVDNFVEVMNEKVQEFGLQGTYFLNPTGLDQNESLSGGYGSANDIAKLFWKVMVNHPHIFGKTCRDEGKFFSLNALKHIVKNTNEQIASIPSFLGGKTGYTDLAGGNLVVAFSAGVDRPIVISVLGSTAEERFSDIEKLIWATFEYLKNLRET